MTAYKENWYLRGSGYSDYIKVMSESTDTVISEYTTTPKNYNSVMAKLEILVSIHNEVIKSLKK